MMSATNCRSLLIPIPTSFPLLSVTCNLIAIFIGGQCYPSGHVIEERQACLPQFLDCSFRQLTAPLGQTFSIYCIMESSSNGGVLNATWSRLNGSLDSDRTVIHTTGDNSSKNASILISDVQRSDQDTYILLASNACGHSNSTVSVVVRNGSCDGYQAPNATHIISYSAVAVEGDDFVISCDFNGDTDPSHYDVEWSKGSWRDIAFYGSHVKYQSYRRDTCPDEPCCSFQDVLVVRNATRNDTNLYSCIAWAVPEGAPQGNSLSVYIVVAPRPRILAPPKSVVAKEGEIARVSCEIGGYPNATRVQWMRDSSIIDVSGSSLYSTQRHTVNASEDVFVATLQFTAFPDMEGRYTCCVSVLREQEDRPVDGSGWIDESRCGEYGTVTVEDGDHISASVFAVGVAGAVSVLLTTFVGLSLVWYQRKRHKAKGGGGYRLIDEQSPSVDYGTTHPSKGLTHSLVNPVGVQTQKGSRKPRILLLYAQQTRHLHKQVQKLSHFLQAQSVLCIDSGAENLRSVETAVQDADIVVIVFSEALHAALTNTNHLSTEILTNFGSLSIQTLRELMIKSPSKFIAISLSGDPWECRELQSQRGYNLTAFEACLRQLPEEDFSERRIKKVLKKEEFGEVREFVRALQEYRKEH